MNASPNSAIALKEWAVICEAVARGRQTVLFRKGGIHEQHGIFSPEHSRFWLYPTGFHQSLDRLITEVRKEAASWQREPLPDVVEISHFAEVQNVLWVESHEDLGKFRQHHVLSDELLRDRYNYRTPGLFVLQVRCSSLSKPHQIPHDPRYDGCHSWVELNDRWPTPTTNAD